MWASAPTGGQLFRRKTNERDDLMEERETVLGLLRTYLKGKVRTLLFFLISAMAFCLIYALYRLPWGPVLYCGMISLTAVLLFGAADFVRFVKRHRQLTTLLGTADLELGILPEPENLIEGDYQQIARVMDQTRAKLISQRDSSREEMERYYTLWAHQIKTPIAAMHLLLDEGEKTEEKKELEQELFKIERYAEMVLQYQRLSTMSSDLLFGEYVIGEMVRQAVRRYASMFIHKKLSVELGELNDTVITDEKWFVFVVEQILSNALKYTRRGKISIYMEKGNAKTLVIEDTGIGIRREDLPRLGERGFTGYNGRMDKKASGLGLFLCRRVLSKLRHGMEIQSEVGVGTRVLLDLSRDEAEMERE